MLAHKIVPKLEMLRPMIDRRQEASILELESLFCKLIGLREALKEVGLYSDVVQQEADVDRVCSELYIIAWEIVGREGRGRDIIKAKAMVVSEYVDADCGLVETGALSLCMHLMSDQFISDGTGDDQNWREDRQR